MWQHMFSMPVMLTVCRREFQYGIALSHYHKVSSLSQFTPSLSNSLRVSVHCKVVEAIRSTADLKSSLRRGNVAGI